MDYSECEEILGLVCKLYKYTYDIDYSAVDGIHTCEVVVTSPLGTQSHSYTHADLNTATVNAISDALRQITLNYPKVLKAQSLKDRTETRVADAPKTSKDDLSTGSTVESSKISPPPQVSTPATSSSQADLTMETSPPVDLTSETSLPVDFSKISPPLPMTRNHLGGNPGNILVISHKVCTESRYEHGVIHVLSNDASMAYNRLNLSPPIKQYWKEQLERTKANESLISYRVNDFLIACHKEIREYIQANEIKTVLLEFPHINTALLQDCGAFGGAELLLPGRSIFKWE